MKYSYSLGGASVVCVCVIQATVDNFVKTVKVTHFKFGLHVPKNSPDITPKHFLKRGHGQGLVTLDFWALNANSSQTINA